MSAEGAALDLKAPRTTNNTVFGSEIMTRRRKGVNGGGARRNLFAVRADSTKLVGTWNGTVP